MKIMKWCLPHPGHLEALKEILKVKDVYEVYMGGLPDFIGSARVLGPSSMESIREQTEYAHEHRVRMNIILNSSCLAGNHLTRRGYSLYHGYLRQLKRMEVDSLTIADPYLIEMASNEFEFDVVASCVSFIDDPEKAKFYEDLGATTLTLDTSINRQFDLLEVIVEVTSCNIKLIVNEGCLYKCPFRYAHLNLCSHRNGPMPRPRVIYNYYQDKCRSMRVKKPELIIKANWIRPEDVKEYEKIGINLFKISGRPQSVNWILKVAEAYTKREYHGNLMEILEYPRDLEYIFYIDNDDLDGVIEKWKKCDKICYRCKFCKELTDEVVKVNESYKIVT
jgi:collagenase-like PrtC family protease